MPRRDAFVQHVLELLAPLGPVRARAMFGGYGLYRDEAMFALIADDALYLKTDDANRPAFEAAGLAPFVYAHGSQRPTTMSYRQAPPEALDDPAAMAPWARAALAAAHRARAAKTAAPRRANAGAGRRTARR